MHLFFIILVRMTVNPIIIHICSGLLAITLIDTLGAIASRKFNFKYVYLSVFSFVVYTLLGYFVAREYSLNATIVSTCLVGIYDATVGWHFSLVLKANNGLTEEQMQQMNPLSRIISMIGIGIIFGYIGYFLGSPT